MIIHIDKVKTIQGVISGYRYQLLKKEANANLDWEKDIKKEIRGKILRGNPLEVIAWAKTSNSEKVKVFSVIISFSESKDELEKKLKEKGKELDDLIRDIESFLFAGYKKEEIAYTIIAHDDTDNFHLHIYVANNFSATGKTLKFWFSPQDFENFRKYIDLKYGFISPDFERKETLSKKIGSKKWKSKRVREKEVLREEIHELVLAGINAGLINDRQSLIEFLETQGLKVRRKGKNYISVEIDGIKIRLKGGIYDENFRIEESFTKTTGRNRENSFGEFEEIQRRIREYYERKNRDISERYGKIRSRLEDNNPKRVKTFTNRKREDRIRGLQDDISFIWNISGNNNSNSYALFVCLNDEIKTLRGKIKMYKNDAERLKREIKLPKLLSYLGLDFYYSGNYKLARVPWRKDENPSLVAHEKEGKWLWYDAGRKEGGSVIDFVMKYFGLSFLQALQWLKERELDINRTEVKAGNLREIKKVEVINLRKPTEDEIALDYFRYVWRLIYLPPHVEVADLKFKERRVRDTQKGFPEIVEVENEYFNPVLVLKVNGKAVFWRDIDPYRTQKGWLTSNQPILIENPNSSNLYVVEGLSDYITLYQIDPNGSFLILGSVSNTDKVISYLQQQEVAGKNIFLVLDNDKGGISATSKIQKYLKSSINLSEKFDYKDFKEFWFNALSQEIQALKKFIKEKTEENERKNYERKLSKGFDLSI